MTFPAIGCIIQIVHSERNTAMKSWIELVDIFAFISAAVFFCILCYAVLNKSAGRLKGFAIGGLMISVIAAIISTVMLWNVQGLI